MKKTFDFKKFSTLIALFILFIILAIATKGDFLIPRNLTNLSLQISINALCAVGMTFVILTGGIDLSIGSIVALSGIIVGLSQVNLGWGEWGGLGSFMSLLLAILVGLLVGLINGLLITFFKIPPFVITLGMMVIAGGLALIASNSSAISPMSDTFKNIAKGFLPLGPSSFLMLAISVLTLYFFYKKFLQHKEKKTTTSAYLSETVLISISIIIPFYAYSSDRGIPIAVLILSFVVLAALFILHKLPLGRYIFAVGGNEEAAHLSGINVNKVKILAYLFMGLIAGLSGALLTSRLNSAAPTAGALMELDAIAAVVIGGTSLSGGSGSIVGSLIGATFIGTVNNGMDLLGIDSNFQMVIKGFIIIVAVWSDSRTKYK